MNRCEQKNDWGRQCERELDHVGMHIALANGVIQQWFQFIIPSAAQHPVSSEGTFEPERPNDDPVDIMDKLPQGAHIIDTNLIIEMGKELEAVLQKYKLPRYIEITSLEYLKACIIRSMQDESGDFKKKP